MAKGKNIIVRKIEKFRNLLIQKYKINNIVLFGSYARNTPHKYSDIDVAVISNDFKKKDRLDVTKELFKIAKEIDVSLEPIGFTYDEYLNCDARSFLAEIKRTGLKVA